MNDVVPEIYTEKELIKNDWYTITEGELKHDSKCLIVEVNGIRLIAWDDGEWSVNYEPDIE